MMWPCATSWIGPLDLGANPCHTTCVIDTTTMRCIITQMTHEWIDTPVQQLNDNTLWLLKHELLQKVCELNNEINDRVAAMEEANVA